MSDEEFDAKKWAREWEKSRKPKVGAEGPEGPVGPEGPQGARGDIGPRGVDGPEGPEGPKGDKGDRGEKGDTGPQGPHGKESIQWVKAKASPAGARGPIGPQGLDGVSGEDGEMGPPGAAGAAGATGAAGGTGAAGPIGPAVFLDAESIEGDQGPMGPTGATGAVGSTGSQGVPGNDGATGAQGPVGVATFLEADAIEGDMGPMGPTGATGASGSVGAQGVPGPVGVAAFLDAEPGEDGLMGPPGAGTPASSVTSSSPGDAAVVGSSLNFAREEHVHLRESLAQSLYDPAADQTLVANATTLFQNDPLILDSGRALVVPSNSLLWTDAITPPSQLAQQDYRPRWDETLLTGYRTIVETDPLMVDQERLLAIPQDSVLWTDGPRQFGAPQGVFNVKDYGAVGDGVADDTIPIQLAINAAQTLIQSPEQATGSAVYLPAGKYRTTATLNVTGPVWISGAGMVSTRITRDATGAPTTDTVSFNVPASGPPFGIRDIQVNTSAAIATCDGVTFNSSNGAFAIRLWVNGFRYGIKWTSSGDCYANNCVVEGANLYGYYLTLSDPIYIDNCESFQNGYGFVAGLGRTIVAPKHQTPVVFRNCQAIEDTSAGFMVDNYSDVKISDCLVSDKTNGSPQYGIWVKNTSIRVDIASPKITRVSQYGIYVTAATNVSIVDPHIDQVGDTGTALNPIYAIFMDTGTSCSVVGGTISNVQGNGIVQKGTGSIIGVNLTDMSLANSGTIGLFAIEINSTSDFNMISGCYLLNNSGPRGTAVRITAVGSGTTLVGISYCRATGFATPYDNNAGAARSVFECSWQTSYLVNGVTMGGALTAAAGTTSLAPITMQIGSSLTTPAIGVAEFDGVSFYKTSDTTNGRKFDDSWNYFRLTGSGTGITGIADFFGANAGIPLVANGVYEIEWHCYFSQVTAGTATWTITTATTALANLTGEYIGSPVGGIGAVGTPQTAAVNVTASSATAFPVTGTEATAVTHYFTVRVLATAGNGASNTRLRLTMGAGTATPLINSYFRVRRLSGANVGTFVA